MSEAPEKIKIDKYCLVLTCGACPEQYDVFDESDKNVGYLRLRHGWFNAKYPDVGGEDVYGSVTIGDGEFHDSERLTQLQNAIKAIDVRILEINRLKK